MFHWKTALTQKKSVIPITRPDTLSTLCLVWVKSRIGALIRWSESWALSLAVLCVFQFHSYQRNPVVAYGRLHAMEYCLRVRQLSRLWKSCEQYKNSTPVYISFVWLFWAIRSFRGTYAVDAFLVYWLPVEPAHCLQEAVFVCRVCFSFLLMNGMWNKKIQVLWKI